MKIQIIYCHPSKKSYTFEILEQLKSNLNAEKLEYEISDLYAMNFKTDMTEQEYEREGFANIDLPIPNDVKEEHSKIEKADCIIFLYPVWWSDCPSKLKGWFDRIYSVGYAYGHKNSNHIEKMKTLKYGLVICTAGHPNDFLQEIGIAESMRNVMIDDRLGQRFSNKEMIILGGTLDKENVRQTHSEVINSIGEKIKRYCA
ncbi:NAD(P)H-dependent oxidoreductase [Aquimarina gracilis]|uniref:NAD(P)H-dependent oxidoreductase n=1 Tax=Aquimarina gracilis TaxID=874422 RepID=A0ABU5ZV45_9FLAO|nr:NAD(P)H-dependent oxidoreductase [Aquimarina gracilis]MEB3345166.1 NAD(P)H-dependent oxidoreductase [Aquimarina gracilis]